MDLTAYRASIEKLMEDLVGPSQPDDDELLSGYFKLFRGNYEDYEIFLQAPMRDTLKARLLVTMLAPSLGYQIYPLPGTKDRPVPLMGLLMHNHWDMKILPTGLYTFIGEVVCFNYNVLPMLEKQLARTSRRTYDHLVLQLLERLDETSDLARRLMCHYSLLDASVYMNMEDASGYKGFEQLLRAPIPEVWKRQADAAMRDIIRLELEGKRKPREEHEASLHQYVHIVNWYKEPPYSAALFASQMEFLLSLPQADLPKLWWSNQEQLFKNLEGPEWHDLRHRLARVLVIRKVPTCIIPGLGHRPDTFSAHGKTSLVESWMQEFANDHELVAALRQPLAEAKARLAEEAAAATSKQACLADLVQRMSVPTNG